MSTKHREIQILPYSTEQLFDLVIDIEQYPQFIPWCSAARIIKKESESLSAELAVNFKGFTSSYISKVSSTRPTSINVEMISGPFKYLRNHWQFNYLDQQKSEIIFDIDFCFESVLLQKMAGAMFEKALSTMINAFANRAEKIYQ